MQLIIFLIVLRVIKKLVILVGDRGPGFDLLLALELSSLQLVEDLAVFLSLKPILFGRDWCDLGLLILLGCLLWSIFYKIPSLDHPLLFGLWLVGGVSFTAIVIDGTIRAISN